MYTEKLARRYHRREKGHSNKSLDLLCGCMQESALFGVVAPQLQRGWRILPSLAPSADLEDAATWRLTLLGPQQFAASLTHMLLAQRSVRTLILLAIPFLHFSYGDIKQNLKEAQPLAKRNTFGG